MSTQYRKSQGKIGRERPTCADSSKPGRSVCFPFHSELICYDLFTSKCRHTLERGHLQCINKIKFQRL